MKSYEVVGYTYEADVWCLDCLPVDSDSDEVGAIFADSEWDEGAYCNVCREELIENPCNYLLGETTIRVEIERVQNTSDLFPSHSNHCFKVQLSTYGPNRKEALFYVYKGLGWNTITRGDSMNQLREYAEDGSNEDIEGHLDEDGYLGSESEQVMREYYTFCVDVNKRLCQFLGEKDYSLFLGE